MPLLMKIELDIWPYGIRTRVASVKGRCPRPLDEGDVREASFGRRHVIKAKPPKDKHFSFGNSQPDFGGLSLNYGRPGRT